VDPFIIGLIATYGGKLIDKLIDGGWVPSADDVRKVTDRRKQALQDFIDAKPRPRDD